MQAKRSINGVSRVRTLVKIVALAAALAFGSAGTAAANDAGVTTEAASSVAVSPVPLCGEAWASSPQQPGQPY